MHFSSADLSYALIIVIVVILIALFVWPGYIWADAHKLDGYWTSNTTGNIYRLTAASARRFKIKIGQESHSGKICGVRKIKYADHSGSVEFDNRRIEWCNGEKWIKQGV
jgi:hypothetical protein